VAIAKTWRLLFTQRIKQAEDELYRAVLSPQLKARRFTFFCLIAVPQKQQRSGCCLLRRIPRILLRINENPIVGGKTVIGNTVSRILLAGSAALALSPSANAADPQSTTATYDDWLLQCQIRSDAAAAPPTATTPLPADKTKAASPPAAGKPAGKATRVCEITQTFTVRETGGTLAKLAIGRMPDSDDIKAILLAPLGVYLPDGPLLKIGDAAELKGQFTFCNRDSCVGELPITKAVVDQIKSAAKISAGFTAANKQRINLTVSTRGFANAFDAAMSQ
jgi:invasion protein IalB